MEIKNLYDLAERQGVTIDFVALRETPALALKHDGKYFVALSKGLSGDSAEEKVALAHELGHINTDAFYSPDEGVDRIRKSERSADRWAVEMLVPLKELTDAIRRGDEGLAELAERFGVPEDFMEKVFRHYCENTFTPCSFAE